MQLVKRHGFTCLTISALVDAIDTGELPERPLAITFDDGAIDFAEQALPALERYELPSTMYVPSALVGRFFPWSRDEPVSGRQVMSWEVLRSLDPSLVELGAHSVTHPQLDVVSNVQRRSEIGDSKTQLENGLGRSIRSFAYPHGYHSAAVRKLVREAGFDSASACGNRWSHVDDDRFALSRLTVFGDMPLTAFDAALTTLPRQHPGPRHIPRFGWRCVRRVRRLAGAVR
jgi:peptidoglycan/xylan/chitin deacetylase (PgdA/CDA1 family)